MTVIHRNVFVQEIRGEMVLARGGHVQDGGDAESLQILHAGGRQGITQVQVGEDLHRLHLWGREKSGKLVCVWGGGGEIRAPRKDIN